MTFDEWFVKYPLPAEIDTMDDTDREQWMLALWSAYKTGAAADRQWVGLTEAEVDRCWNMTPMDTRNSRHMFAYSIEAKLKEKNNG